MNLAFSGKIPTNGLCCWRSLSISNAIVIREEDKSVAVALSFVCDVLFCFVGVNSSEDVRSREGIRWVGNVGCVEGGMRVCMQAGEKVLDATKPSRLNFISAEWCS